MNEVKTNVNSTLTNKYLNSSVEEIKSAIEKTHKAFLDQAKMAQVCLNGQFLSGCKSIEALSSMLEEDSNDMKLEIVPKEVMQMIKLVEMFQSTTIPNAMKLLQELSQKNIFTEQERNKVETCEQVVENVKKTIGFADLFNTSQGQMQVYLDSLKK